jgi:prepilin-type N-terminal cleavage/methylation domain-containing protein
MKNDKGFTLIELMISISILSLLLYTGSYMYSTLANRWDREIGEFNQHFEQSRSLILLQELLSGVMPFVIRDTQQADIPTMFFVGAEDSLLAVSRGGIVNSAYPEIFRLSAVQNDNDKFDLVYQSTSTKNIVLLNTVQEIEFEHRFMLIENAEDIKFRYFGWPSFQVKNQSTEENASELEQSRWFNNYSGVDKQLNPEQIAVSVTVNTEIARFAVTLDSSSQRFLEHYLSDLEEQ